jgi:monothiol glutaredoxin
MPTEDAVQQKIAEVVRSRPVVLFMKGTPQQPACGFSAAVIKILDGLGADYGTVDVLSDEAIRSGVKAFTGWPTIPQVFIGGEFVGGADIIRAMDASGELARRLGVSAAPAPTITIKDAAARALIDAGADAGDERLRLEISPSFDYDLYFGPVVASDVEAESNGVRLRIDAGSARRADGLVIDFVPGDRGGFSLESPKEPARVRPLRPEELKAMLDRGEALELYDVRTEQERRTASIAGSRFFDEEARARLDGLPRDTTLVFQCHHGHRSQMAAERVVQSGFRKVFNLVGGIDAWSVSVDPSVPRY